MGKSKAIGTNTETAVVRVLRERGWPSAERRALTGAIDLGDITGTPGITWQVKGGHMAEAASDGLVREWMDDLYVQQSATHDPVGVLVWKRYAVGTGNAHRWWAAMEAQTVQLLLAGQGYAFRGAEPRVICRMTLEEAIRLLRFGGYGS